MAGKELPRSWNKNLLPNFQVIAVEERDIENPNWIVTNSEELPDYPSPDKLLEDPSYIRLRRLGFERAIHNFYDGNRKAINWFMTEGISTTLSDTSTDNKADVTRREIIAIYNDYSKNPLAFVAKLN